MQQSVRLARITVEVDQRAWLSLRQEPFQFHTGTELSIPLTANNIGKTPARNIRGWVFVQRVQKDTNVDFSSPTDTTPPRKYAYTKFNQGVMFPNDPTTFKEAYMGEIKEEGHPPVRTVWTDDMQGQWVRGEFFILYRARFTLATGMGS
jgi:hypothetical protein